MWTDFKIGRLREELNQATIRRDIATLDERRARYELDCYYRSHDDSMKRLRRRLKILRATKKNIEHKKNRSESLLRATKIELASTSQLISELKEKLEQRNVAYQMLVEYLAAATRNYNFNVRQVQIAERERRNYAKKKGVPDEYLNDLIIQQEPDGTVSIFFGGTDHIAGEGHAHLVIDDREGKGEVLYIRPKGATRGRQHHRGHFHDDGKGGFDGIRHGFIEDIPVTYAYGWGTRKGLIEICDGHLSWYAYRACKHPRIYDQKEGQLYDSRMNPIGRTAALVG